MNPQFGTNETAETNTFLLQNLKICCSSNAQTTQTSTIGQPVFGQAASTASIFKTPSFTFDSDKSLFGGASKTSIFGESSSESSVSSSTTTKTATAAVTRANSILKTSTVVTTSITSNQFSNSMFSANSTPFSKMTFGSNNTLPFGSSTTTTTIFGGTIAPTTTANFFGGTTAATVANVFAISPNPPSQFAQQVNAGINPQFGTNETAETNTLLQNLKICSPSDAQTTQTRTIGQPVFDQAASTASIFKTPSFTFDSDKSLFGGASKTSIFGDSSSDSSVSLSTTTKTATAAVTRANSILQTSTVVTTSITSNSSTTTNFFGGITAATTTNIFGKTTAPTTSNIFGGSTAPTTTNVFGGTTAATVANVFGTTTMTNVFGATATSTVFDTKPSDNIQKNEDNSIFSVNDVSFSVLAAAAAQPETFKVDPNFSFAGARSSVFGSKSASSLNSSTNVNKLYEDSVQKENNEETMSNMMSGNTILTLNLLYLYQMPSKSELTKKMRRKCSATEPSCTHSTM
ncbi:uncharacterized protein Klc isoform X2 [Temnothorax longispinosus]